MLWGSQNRKGRDDPQYQSERTAQMVQFFQRYLQTYRAYTSELTDRSRQLWQEQYDYIQALQDEHERLRQSWQEQQEYIQALQGKHRRLWSFLLSSAIKELAASAGRIKGLLQYLGLGMQAAPKMAMTGTVAVWQRWLASSYSVKSRPGVMFVYADIGAPSRYRVTYQQEQLTMQNIANESYEQTDLRALDALRRHRVLYLYRVQATQVVLWLIRLARLARIPVVFDTDDITWGEEVLDFCYVHDHFSPEEIEQLVRSLRGLKRVMQSVDYFVLSTDYLARLVKSEFGKPVWVNQNAFSRELHRLSDPFYLKKIAGDFRPESAILGYFSGWPKDHQEDFESIAEPLARLLSDRPNAQLKVFGYLDLGEFLTRFPGRVSQHPFVEWQQLPELISTVDISLAPLVDNPHRRSKSSIKYIEAALVGVPTVATDLEPYRSIQHRKTGFLASNNEQWYKTLIELVDSPGLRRAMGIAAHDSVVQSDSTFARSANFNQIYREILEIYYG
jgi:glycosyltransferase involved in cell wall biosynthesis